MREHPDGDASDRDALVFYQHCAAEMTGRRRLRTIARALQSPAVHSATLPVATLPVSACGDAVVDSNADLTLEEHLFVFDLQGFVVIEDVLQSEQVERLNALIDMQDIAPGVPEVLPDGSSGSRVRFGSSGGGARNTGPGFLEWGQEFVNLLDQPAVAPFLAALIPKKDGLGVGGAGIRLDRLYGIHQDRNSSGILPTGTGLGGFHRDYEGSYDVKMGVFSNSFIVVAWALSDSGGDAGGFVCFVSHAYFLLLHSNIIDAALPYFENVTG